MKTSGLARVAHYSERLLHDKLTNGMGTRSGCIGASKRCDGARVGFLQ
jgi:hypothetical protein